MSKVKMAKIVLGICWGFVALAVLGVVWFVGWLLVLWAGAHFVSFAWVMGIAGAIGLVIGVSCAGSWATETLDKANLDEKIEEYTNKYGQAPKYNYGNDRYEFDKPPAGWAGIKAEKESAW